MRRVAARGSRHKMVVASKISVKPRAKMTKSNKIAKSLLIVAQELKLARILAGNNKTLRDRTLKKLKKWFDAREAQMRKFNF